jgi:hypothetical protein
LNTREYDNNNIGCIYAPDLLSDIRAKKGPHSVEPPNALPLIISGIMEYSYGVHTKKKKCISKKEDT